jgi:hypothetical protein
MIPLASFQPETSVDSLTPLLDSPAKENQRLIKILDRKPIFCEPFPLPLYPASEKINETVGEHMYY